MSDDEITCRTPTEGKQPTRIDRWKFDAVRGEIVQVAGQRPQRLIRTT
jgi:hypothetical protein